MSETVHCVRCRARTEILALAGHRGTTNVVHAASEKEERCGVLLADYGKPQRFLCLECLDLAAVPIPDLSPEVDERKFRAWSERVKAGLGPFTKPEREGFWPRHAPEPGELRELSPRLSLILEIGKDLRARWPIGIAVRLAYVIASLADGEEDDAAILDLEDLVADEVNARELDPRDAAP